jgi:succinate dehydrogenase hydrophobic anchor subunit
MRIMHRVDVYLWRRFHVTGVQRKSKDRQNKVRWSARVLLHPPIHGPANWWNMRSTGVQLAVLVSIILVIVVINLSTR